ncbi:MAG: hypothetical protein DMF61_17220 [Blastocatellia bacterium AA13]|nr:MAG: hypothetical protein DMF61_17220 [Blastocatellia bacterium AA13]
MAGVCRTLVNNMSATKKHANLAAALTELIGPANTTVEDLPEIDGCRPAVLVMPSSHDEVKDSLKICADYDASVAPAGRLTWLDCGNPIERADVIISSRRMDCIIDYSPADLTATVQAGVSICRLNQLAGESRQWLPVDAPGTSDDTLGALAACGVSGPLRYGFGTIRDYALGLKLAHANGGESKSGGRVVKNVAGYDMTKLYVGSYGTLAIITELTLKLRPMADGQATLAIISRARDSLFELGTQIVQSELRPASVYIIEGDFPDVAPGSALLVRFIETREAVDYQIDRVIGLMDGRFEFELLSDERAAAAWLAVANFDRSEQVAVRWSVPPSNTRSVFESINQARSRTADLALGIIRGCLQCDSGVANTIALLRERAAAAGGHLFIEKAPASVRRDADAFGDPGAARRLMIAVKEKLDPLRALNPGKFIRGI